MSMSFRLLLDPQGGEGTTAPEKKVPASEPEGYKALLEKHGSPDAVALTLYTDNYKLRDKNRELSARIPAEGAVVLSGDDAARWRSYQELGKPDDLKKIVREHGEFSKENGRLKRTTELDDIADLAGYKRSVFRTVAGDTAFVVTEEKKRDASTGKDVVVRVPHVKGEGDETTPLSEYAEAHWTDFLPSLDTDQGKQAGPRGTPPRDFPPTTDPAERRRGGDPATAFLLKQGGYTRQ
jgi:hypothetical protein